MIKRLLLVLLVLSLPVTMHAEQICNRTANVAVAPGNTEIVPAVAGSTVRVCAFVIASNVASGFQFFSGGAAVSGVMFVPANDSVPFGAADSIQIMGISSANLAVSATSAVFGIVIFQQQ